jgi:cation diffusion facilitator family transporter
MQGTGKIERRAILLSVWGNLVAALLGLFFAFLTNSEAVLIDGIYSLINFAVALVALKVSKMVQRPDNELYPFGYAVYEPILNLTKGLLILLVTVFALFTASTELLSGGRPVNALETCIYATLATLLCGAVTCYLRRQSGLIRSPIVAVDAKNWWIDTLISAGVAIAFFIAVVIKKTPYAGLAPYVDPVVVIVLVMVMLPVPWHIIRENWAQIVSRAVEPECLAEVEAQLDKVRAEIPWRDQHLRVLRMGRLLYVHVYILEDPIHTLEADRCREKIYQTLKEIHADLALDVSFTADPIWMRRASGDE